MLLIVSNKTCRVYWVYEVKFEYSEFKQVVNDIEFVNKTYSLNL